MATRKPPVSELAVFMFSLFIIRSGCQNLSYTESSNSSYSESHNSSYSKSHNGSYTESHNSSYSKSHNGSYTISYNSSYTGGSYDQDPPSVQRSYGQDTLNVEERKALLTFLKSVNHSAQLINWNESEVACSWRGVTCDPAQTNVLYLRLPDMQLTGEIPKNTIGKLTNLRVLSLSFNNLSNEIPSDFSNLTYLTTLFLNNNNFSGQLPLITSKYLTSFNVSYNKLDSSIPYSLSKFPKSAFFNNVYLCGDPFPDHECNSSYPSTNRIEQYKMPDDKREIVGVSLGSSLLFLILLCSVVKNIMYRPKKKKPTPSKASEIGRNSELVLFDGSDSFDLDCLLKEPTRVLGEGSVGTTLGVGANTTVIVKRLKHVMVTDQEFETKMKDLGKMKNDNVVTLRGFCKYSEDEKWLIYDYMPAGSLSAHLHGSTGSDQTQLNWDHRIRIALSAAKGLAYLHSAKEVHGNIKPSNIFIRQKTNFEASLSEYGLNTLFHGSSNVNHQDTSNWAPEVFQTREFTFASDVYSFGVSLFELFTRKTPNQALSGKEGVHFSKWIASIVCEESKSELFDVELTRDHNVDKMVRLLQIVKACASVKPQERPPMDNVVMLLKQSSDYH